MKTSELPDNQFELIEAGLNDAKLKRFTLKQGEKGGYLNCEFIIIGGENKGRIVFSKVSLSVKSLWKFKEFALALGQEEEYDWISIVSGADHLPVIDEESLVEEASALIGKVCQIDVTIRKVSEKDKKEKGWKDGNDIRGYSSQIEFSDGLPSSSTEQGEW